MLEGELPWLRFTGCVTSMSLTIMKLPHTATSTKRIRAGAMLLGLATLIAVPLGFQNAASADDVVDDRLEERRDRVDDYIDDQVGERREERIDDRLEERRDEVDERIEERQDDREDRLDAREERQDDRLEGAIENFF